ncbi:MAG: hypothetical protein C4297_04785 [Gemmataceae bacterium]
MNPKYRFIAYVCGIALAPLLGCEAIAPWTLCGYTVGSPFPCDIRTVRVPIFRNQTPIRGLEFQLTEEVIKRIEMRTPWKVVQDGPADAELIGKIVAAPKRVLVHNPLNEIREGEYTLVVEVTWRDLRPVVGPGADSSFDTPEHTAPDALPLPASRLAPAAPQRLQRSATFIPELGESTLTARHEAIVKLADTIVNMMESPW